jgi:hypothetical protein
MLWAESVIGTSLVGVRVASPGGSLPAPRRGAWRDAPSGDSGQLLRVRICVFTVTIALLLFLAVVAVVSYVLLRS